MANTYKNIVITPNTASSTGDPTIVFSGGNTTVNTDITLRVYPEANGTLSFEGAAGQLFSITNDLTGSIYSVNDVSGIPSIDVQANGMVSLAPYGGNVAIDGSLLFVDTVGNKVGIGTMAPLAKLEVVSSSQAATDRSTHFELSTGTGLLTDEKLVFGISDGSYSWIQAVKQATGYRNLSLNPSGGNVAIGRTTANYRLDVAGQVNASALLVNGVAVGGGLTVSDQTTSASTFYPLFTTTTSGTASVANVATSKLYFVPSTGTLSATIFNSLSDITLKTDIEQINGIELLNTINPVSFKWKDTGVKSYGVIAQDLEQVLPELVETNDQGLKSVSYIPIIAMLVDAVQKQQKEIDKLKTLLNTK